jgi:hypothetical protein
MVVMLGGAKCKAAALRRVVAVSPAQSGTIVVQGG